MNIFKKESNLTKMLGLFGKNKKDKVSSREKKEILNKAVKKDNDKKRQLKANQLQEEDNGPLAGQKKIEQKKEYTEDEVLIFELDPMKVYQHRIEHYSGQPDQIIMDEQFLLDDNDDPEKVLEEMKKKQQRLLQMEEEEKKLSDNIKKANKEQPAKIDEESEAFKKIKEYLKKSPSNDRLDFTQNLLKMAQELGKLLTISGVLPSFKILSTDNDSIKIALIEQILPIASFLIESHDCDEYQHCLSVMVPILNEFLYDKSEKVKKKAVKALVDF